MDLTSNNFLKFCYCRLSSGRRIPASVSITVLALLLSGMARAQGSNASVNARISARQITIGDQARIFIEAQVNPASARLQWAAIPDTFNDLEVTERDKIDTVKNGDLVTYSQRLVITGFDSGQFKVPAFVFAVIPNSGTAYTVQTDSFLLTVQTVPVDTTKAFKGIKNIIYVKSSWRDYIGYILGVWAVLLIVVVIVVVILKRAKKQPLLPARPSKTLQEVTLGKLAELDAKQLWQKNKVKEYYIELTDIVRNYIEERFQTQALELTTDELLYKVQRHRELQPYYEQLATILHTADLAKFAKAQPLPDEHISAMDKSKEFVETSKPKPEVTEQPSDK